MIGEPLFRRNLKNEIFEFKILKRTEKDRKLAEKGCRLKRHPLQENKVCFAALKTPATGSHL